MTSPDSAVIHALTSATVASTRPYAVFTPKVTPESRATSRAASHRVAPETWWNNSVIATMDTTS